MMQTKITYLSLWALLILFSACDKKMVQYDFVIRCKTPDMYLYSPNYGAVLAVSDANGNILEVFDIKSNETDIERTLKVDENIQHCNLHLAFRPDNHVVYIYSHLEVQNGSFIEFEPEKKTEANLSTQKVIRVEGIQYYDTLGLLGVPYLQSGHNAGDTYASTSSHFSPNQGAVLVGRAVGTSEYRYLYLPDSIMASFSWDYFVSWDQFKPVPAPKSVTIAPEFPPVLSMNVDAITSDLKHYVSIGPGQKATPSNLEFIHPVETPQALRIQLLGDHYATERIFQEGESLEFAMTNMKIGDISATPGKGFKISTSGDIDLLEVVCNESTYYEWNIVGKPGSFQDATMPNLTEIFSQVQAVPSFPTPFWRFKVIAHQYDKYNYADIKEGKHVNSGNIFYAADGGYFRIEVSHE